MENLQKQVNNLKTAVALLSVLVLGMLIINISLFRRGNQFNELSVRRINIVEDDGTLRMAISNHRMQDPGSYDGKKIPMRDRPAGMIFFNDQGDECGGLIYDGNKQNASMTYSIDQYQNDQIMQLQYQQDSTGTAGQTRSYGLKFWDRDDRYPTGRLLQVIDSLKRSADSTVYRKGMEYIRAEGGLGRERMYLGKDQEGNYGITIRDGNGRPRIRLLVNRENNPVIESIDDKGIVSPR